jgi:glycosyltransferase involved in cell wall biosynthesis
MACETEVVAIAVGGIKEVVVQGATGLLEPLDQQTESPFEALDPARYAGDLADAINSLMADPERRHRMAQAGRKRAVEKFSWTSIAQRTMALYETLVKGSH